MDTRRCSTEQAAARTCGVLSLSQLRELGWTRDQVRQQVRSRRWRRLLAGVVLVDEALAATAGGWAALPLLTRVRAGLAAHGAGTVVVGHTAARLHGLGGLPADDGVVHLRRPPGGERHQQPGVRLHTLLLAERDTCRLDDIRVTSCERTVVDLVLQLGRADAVSLLDAALRAGDLLPEQLAIMREGAQGRRGVARSARWWGEADGRSESPLETRIRLAAVDAGYPPDHLQLLVRTAGGALLGYADMAWDLPGGRILVAEADGAEVHSRPEALFRDRRRANSFVGTGRVDMVRFTWADLRAQGYVGAVLGARLGPHLSRRS